jgi:hypothetical protein
MSSGGEREKESVELRLAKIESKLDELAKGMGSGGGQMKASKEDIEAYNRVLRAAVATDWGEFCGINDCSKCIVVVCRQPRLCSIDICSVDPCFECSCGPCNEFILGRRGRFGRRAREFESLGY